MRSWPSSGPRMKSSMLLMPKLGATWPTIAHRDLDVLGLRLALDLLEALDRHLPGQLEIRAGGRPEPEYELARIDLGEQLGAQLQSDQPEDQPASRQIAGHHHPSPANQLFNHPLEDVLNSIEEPLLLLVLPPCA